MVSVAFNLGKRDFIWIGLIVVLVGVGFVYGYGGNDPAVMGHTYEEIEFAKSWQDVSGQGNVGESCIDWLTRTGQAGDIRRSLEPSGATRDSACVFMTPSTCWYGSPGDENEPLDGSNYGANWYAVDECGGYKTQTYRPSGASGGLWEVSGSDVYRSSGNVGIGGAPDRPFTVKGEASSPGYTTAFFSDNNGKGVTLGTNAGNVGVGIVSAYDLGNMAHLPLWLNKFIWINKNNARVGIGTTNPAWTLDVAGIIRGTNVASSDSRLKKNVVVLEDSLEKIMALRGVEFEWIKESEYENGGQIGLIAQEVESVLPEVVYTDDEGYKSVDYAKIVSVLVEAMKEQEERILELEARC